MNIQNIIKEAINKDPLALKEALSIELRERLSLALEAKMDKKNINEISDKTLNSYIKKAPKSMLKMKAKKLFFGDPDGNLHNKFNKRAVNFINASNKLTETSVEQDLEDHHPRIVSGIRGVKSTPFSKKFKNQEHMEKWMDSDDFDHEIHHVGKA